MMARRPPESKGPLATARGHQRGSPLGGKDEFDQVAAVSGRWFVACMDKGLASCLLGWHLGPHLLGKGLKIVGRVELRAVGTPGRVLQEAGLGDAACLV